MKAVEVTDSNYETLLQDNPVVLFDFWAAWCGPCRIIGPVVDELAEEFEGKALIGKVNVDNNPQVAAKYGIRSIPTLLIFKQGEVAEKQVGVVPKQTLSDQINAQLTA